MINQNKKKIVVIGQGFVGLPMSVAIANSKNQRRKCNFQVIGIEKNNYRGKYLKKQINDGKLPIKNSDKKIYQMFANTKKNKNYHVSTELSQVKLGKVVIVSINFEINEKKKDPFLLLKKFFTNVAKLISKNTLIIVETTLPPGTCDKIIYPILTSICFKRGFSRDEIMLSYSYERIMPGYNYYNSIVNNNRVFSGINEKSKKACKSFLEKIINVKKFPLSLLNTNTECEFAKILENSYRASNIALIDEWTKYSKIANVNIYNVIQAIKKRETHKNIMRPGLGVGGYCLTKDPMFALASVKKVFKNKNQFPFIKLTMKTNQNMPLTSVSYIKDKIKSIKHKKILLLGLSYREGVADYRSSPSLILYKKLKHYGAKISANDPLIDISKEKELGAIHNQKNKLSYYDAIIFCTPHKEFNKIDLRTISKKTTIIDLNNVFSENKKELFKKLNIKLFTLGIN